MIIDFYTLYKFLYSPEKYPMFAEKKLRSFGHRLSSLLFFRLTFNVLAIVVSTWRLLLSKLGLIVKIYFSTERSSVESEAKKLP
jgi:hypothetical protein